MRFQIYTDGSCHPNPGGPGAWAWASYLDGVLHTMQFGSTKSTTSNKMELTAISRVVHQLPKTAKATIYSDSKYAVNCLTVWPTLWRRRRWTTRKGKPIKNKRLIKRTVRQLQLKPDLVVKWIPGHAGIPGNEFADFLAERAARRLYPD